METWGPDYGKQEMLDGTDVDAQISKKRAHKIIMAEAALAENRHKMKLKSKRKTMVKKPADDPEAPVSGQVGGQANDSDLKALVAELEGSGYIIEGGNITSMDLPHLDTANKLAMNVIQTQVRDHYDPELDEDANFDKLKGNLMKALEKNAAARQLTIQPG